ncbi:acyltransferase family protein [Corynebacterium sp. HMSC08C04]|uniref:acyltransferase family protein n=1 Tax=Corynebacterium sp. HMSC08C04 TaxID=1581137 RepID=UPI001FEEACE0|nr:acyltransferase family protein [Corynebacterium sp. HMSC08C04]
MADNKDHNNDPKKADPQINGSQDKSAKANSSKPAQQKQSEQKQPEQKKPTSAPKKPENSKPAAAPNKPAAQNKPAAASGKPDTSNTKPGNTVPKPSAPAPKQGSAESKPQPDPQKKQTDSKAPAKPAPKNTKNARLVYPPQEKGAANKPASASQQKTEAKQSPAAPKGVAPKNSTPKNSADSAASSSKDAKANKPAAEKPKQSAQKAQPTQPPKQAPQKSQPAQQLKPKTSQAPQQKTAAAKPQPAQQQKPQTAQQQKPAQKQASQPQKTPAQKPISPKSLPAKNVQPGAKAQPSNKPQQPAQKSAQQKPQPQPQNQNQSGSAQKQQQQAQPAPKASVQKPVQSKPSAPQAKSAEKPAEKPKPAAKSAPQTEQKSGKKPQPSQPKKNADRAGGAGRAAGAAAAAGAAGAAGTAGASAAKSPSAKTPAADQEIKRALARRSQPVGTPTPKQMKPPKPSREARKNPEQHDGTGKAASAGAVAGAAAGAASASTASASEAPKKTSYVQPPQKASQPKQDSKPAKPVMVDRFPHEPEALKTPHDSKEVKRTKRARLRQVKGLDGLRGLAVLAVVIYHFFGDVLPGGYLGVDMFFVLSGFLITSLLVREFRVSGRISLKDFWVRRFRRILPAALTVLIICTAIVALISGDIAVGIREQFLGTFFFVNNWTQIATSQSYFADNEIQVFAHYWSLAVEEQFYVIWPLLIFGVFAISRRQPRRLPIAISLLLAIASGVAMWLIYTPGQDPTRVYYGTDTHAFGLLIGAILSLIVTSTKSHPKADSWPSPGKSEQVMAGVIGTFALAGYIAQLFLMPDDAEFTYRGGLILTSVLGALMIWGVIREFGPLKWIFSTAVMRWLGQRSFSLYLWHWPVVMILRAIFDGNHSSDKPWILGLVAVPISFLLAELSYQFVENPFRRGGYKKTWTGYWAARPSMSEMKDGFAKAFWPLVPLIVVASLVGVGYALATSSDKSELEQQLEQLQKQNKSTQNGGPAPAAAPSTQTEKTRRPMPTGNEITAIGDSVMLAASEALQQRYPGIYIDAEVSRHYSAAPPIIEQLKAAGDLRSTVFLGFGTNGPAFPDQIQEVVDLIGPDHTIVMAVPYGDREWMAQSQSDVIDAAKKYDNVYLADWCTHAQNNPNLLYSDGIHPLPEGASEYALAFHYALLQYSNYDKNLDSKCQI